jgi:flagellar motor protein MotB
MNILDNLSESNFFGPGTDIIISFTAVLILLFAVNSNLHHKQMSSIEKRYQDHIKYLLNAYKKIGDRLKKVDDLPDSKRKIEAVIDINQDLYEQLAKAKKENAQTLQIVEDLLKSYNNKKKGGLKRSEYFPADLDLNKVRNSQISIINEIAKRYGTVAREKTKNTYVISIDHNDQNDIVIQNEITSQVFTFGSHILFDLDKVELKPEGRDILISVGNIFRGKLDFIREIQIQGHADPQPSKRYVSNLQLAANRAITVFKLFKNEIGIDPSQSIMSATSFGQYMPIQRTYYDRDYNHFQLTKDNNTPEKRTRNRRIEIVLFYFFI